MTDEHESLYTIAEAVAAGVLTLKEDAVRKARQRDRKAFPRGRKRGNAAVYTADELRRWQASYRPRTRDRGSAALDQADELTPWQQIAGEPVPEPIVSDELCGSCGETLVWALARTVLHCQACGAIRLPAIVAERQRARTAPAIRESDSDQKADLWAGFLLALDRRKLHRTLGQLEDEIGDPANAVNPADADRLAEWLDSIAAVRDLPVGSRAELERVRELADELAHGIREHNPHILRHETETVTIPSETVRHHELEAKPDDEPVRSNGSYSIIDEWAVRRTNNGKCHLCQGLFKRTADYEIRAVISWQNLRGSRRITPPDPLRVCAAHLYAGRERIQNLSRGYPPQVERLSR